MEWDPRDRSPAANYHFLTSSVAPRPIAWVTTVDRPGGTMNAAPFSWFQAVCADPPMLMLAIADRGGEPKDTLRNVMATGEFVVNLATADNRDALVQSSADYPADRSEVDTLHLAVSPSVRVAPPRLDASPVHLECRLVETHRYGGPHAATTVVVGEVVHVGAADEVLDARGNVDPRKARFLTRLGGRDYAIVDDVFPMDRPTVREPPE